MKCAKKMRLVEVDDIPNNYSNTITDENYTKPRMLSSLDNKMMEILKSNSLHDFDKWMLYNQTLQRYLKFVENGNTQAIHQTGKKHSVKDDSSFSHSPLPPFELIDNVTTRDSLDAISLPGVREFFEKARQVNNTDNMPQEHKRSSSDKKTKKET